MSDCTEYSILYRVEDKYTKEQGVLFSCGNKLLFTSPTKGLVKVKNRLDYKVSYLLGEEVFYNGDVYRVENFYEGDRVDLVRYEVGREHHISVSKSDVVPVLTRSIISCIQNAGYVVGVGSVSSGFYSIIEPVLLTPFVSQPFTQGYKTDIGFILFSDLKELEYLIKCEFFDIEKNPYLAYRGVGFSKNQFIKLVKEHPTDFCHYCEILITKNGMIYLASPSHVYRESILNKRHLAPISVWYDRVESYNGYTEAQLDVIETLKNLGILSSRLELNKGGYEWIEE